MEAKFKVGDVVVQDDINVSAFKMCVEFTYFVDGKYEYTCAFFELGELFKERFKEDRILFEDEFNQRVKAENRNYKIDRILREV